MAGILSAAPHPQAESSRPPGPRRPGPFAAPLQPGPPLKRNRRFVLAFSNLPARGTDLLIVLILILVLGLIATVVSSGKASVGPGRSRSTPWERAFLLATPVPLFVMWALPALLQLTP